MLERNDVQCTPAISVATPVLDSILGSDSERARYVPHVDEAVSKGAS
jgi:hypothetical protein